MTDTDHFARAVHDLTAAVWFGGSLMGAVGLDGATTAARDPRERTRLSVVGWNRWRPVETCALTAHVLSSAWLLRRTGRPPAVPRAVRRTAAAKAVVTAAGIATAAYSGRLGRIVEAHAEEGGAGTTVPRTGASPELAAAQRRLDVLQWVNPAAAAVVVVLGARRGAETGPPGTVRAGD